MTDTEILIAWLRCFDADENDGRMASRCADALEQKDAEIEKLTDEWYSPGHMDAVQERTIDPQRKRIERLESSLSLCASRLESCIVASGSDREYAVGAVAAYRRLLTAGDSIPSTHPYRTSPPEGPLQAAARHVPEGPQRSSCAKIGRPLRRHRLCR